MKIKIPLHIYRKMMLAAKYASPYEIAGFVYGTVDKNFTVEDIDIFTEQNITPSSVNVEVEEIAQHIINIPSNKISKIIGVWHSHGHIKAFTSTVDESTCILLLEKINPILIITVNAHREITATAYVKIKNMKIKTKLQVEIDLGEDEKLKKEIEKIKSRTQLKINFINHLNPFFREVM